MVRLTHTKKLGGTVLIYDKDVVDNVVDDSERDKTQLQLKKSCRHLQKSNLRDLSALNTASASGTQSKKPISKIGRVQDWLDEKAIKELQDRANNECQAAKKLYSPLLETERTFIKELGDFLAYKDHVDLQKKEVLHKKWSDQVYEPIRKQILAAVDDSERHNLDHRKREMHKQFLEHVNKRGFVFLENDNTEEYCAQALNGQIRIRTEALSDPLLTQSRQKSEEDRIIMRCLTGHRYSDKDLDQVRLPPLPLGRPSMNSCGWLGMPFSSIESTTRERSRRRVQGLGTKTNIDFGAWAQADFDPKVVERELQIPRKKTFSEQPPFGKPPVQIPPIPFIDPEDFADKIINVNPFPQHAENLRAEKEALEAFLEYQQNLEQEMMEQQQQQQQILVET